MRNNKILATAMTTALAGALSAGGVNAGMDEVTYPDATYPTPPMNVATEDVGVGQTLPSNCNASKITVVYIADTELATNTQVKFTLKEGAEAGDAAFQTLSTIPSGATNPSNISPGTLTVEGSMGNSSVISLIEGGEGANTMAFRIQEAVAKESTLTFSFCIYKADILQDANQSIGLTIELLDENETAVTGESTGTYNVLLAKDGTSGNVSAGVDDGNVKVDIGAGGGAKKFTGSRIDQMTAILGEVCLQSASSVYASDLFSPWGLAANASGATFTITDAPFNASIGHTTLDPAALATATADQLAGVMVFLDLNGDSVFDAGDIPADTVDTTNASFTIDGTELTNMLDPTKTKEGRSNVDGFNNSQVGCVAVVFKASGNDEIKTHDVAPTGKFDVTFSGGTQTITGKLNHIKRSGTVCVLYNIPGPNSIENANIRVTNKSATPDGTLIGTLRLPDGTEIFTDYDILTATGLGLIGPNQTMYLNTDKLDEIAQSASNPNGAWTDGWTRAILRLETNLDYVEMMALIRDDDVMGAPLMNMSTGASGNGCGR